MRYPGPRLCMCVCVCVYFLTMCLCVLHDVFDLVSNRRIKTLKQRSPEDERWIKILEVYSWDDNTFYGDLTKNKWKAKGSLL